MLTTQSPRSVSKQRSRGSFRSKLGTIVDNGASSLDDQHSNRHQRGRRPGSVKEDRPHPFHLCPVHFPHRPGGLSAFLPASITSCLMTRVSADSQNPNRASLRVSGSAGCRPNRKNRCQRGAPLGLSFGRSFGRFHDGLLACVYVCPATVSPA